MKTFLFTLFLALGLSGCAGIELTKQTATKTLGKVENIDQRIARLCLAGAGFSEIVTFISSREDPLYVDTALPMVKRLIGSIASVRAEQNRDWLNVQIFYFKREVSRFLTQRGEKRVKQILQPGIDLDGAFGFLVNLDLAAHVVLDIRTLMAGLTAKPQTVTLEQANAACDSRLAFNLERLERLNVAQRTLAFSR